MTLSARLLAPLGAHLLAPLGALLLAAPALAAVVPTQPVPVTVVRVGDATHVSFLIDAPRRVRVDVQGATSVYGVTTYRVLVDGVPHVVHRFRHPEHEAPAYALDARPWALVSADTPEADAALLEVAGLVEGSAWRTHVSPEVGLALADLILKIVELTEPIWSEEVEGDRPDGGSTSIRVEVETDATPVSVSLDVESPIAP